MNARIGIRPSLEEVDNTMLLKSKVNYIMMISIFFIINYILSKEALIERVVEWSNEKIPLLRSRTFYIHTHEM